MTDAGFHNQNFEQSIKRLEQAKTYQDLSTVWICPTPDGKLSSKVVGSWISLMKPMNQKIYGPVFIEGQEVGKAYQSAVEMILGNDELKTWKYMLTVEQDNCPPPDGLLKLYESMDRFDVVGGLYWTKGEGGQPMVYGDPASMPKNFIPQIPRSETLHECNGLGMGFNLFKIEMFRKLSPPWFRTVQEVTPAGVQTFSQDLWFFQNAGRQGFRFACDTRIKVGHYDAANRMMW